MRHWRLGLRLAGAGLLVATATIHLDLYLTGYRSIPTIGWMFMLQVDAAFGLAAAVLVTGSRILAAAGALFALATLGGYVQAIWIGLFGFKEIRSAAGIAAGVIEVAAFAVLATLAAFPATPGQPDEPTAATSPLTRWFRVRPADIPGAGRAVAGISVLALLVFGISVARAGGHSPAAASGLKTATVGGVRVLTSAQGFTLYWFVADTATRSNCNGTCAGYWPPVTGTPPPSPGIPGTFGTIKRQGGVIQVTYNGHPLYTYVGDTAPGQTFGNNLNLNGGLWHEVIVAG